LEFPRASAFLAYSPKSSLKAYNLRKGETSMPIPITEVLRVAVFDTVEFEDRDWDGPKPLGELLTYTSLSPTSSLRVTRGGKAIFDKDYPAKKTITIDGNVIHLPVGAKKEP
jgi:hypothetical protein